MRQSLQSSRRSSTQNNRQLRISVQSITRKHAEEDAKLVTAQAYAEANALLEKLLTSHILQEKYIEKWNGQLPNVIAGDDGTSILVQPTP